MKTRLNSLNRTANAAKISGGGNSHARCGNLVFNPDGHPTVNRQSTIASLSSHYSQYALILTTTLLLLFTLGVGNAWGNYAYLDLSGFTQWYEKGEEGTVDPDFTVSITSDHCNKVQVNGNSGVWRFNIGNEEGTAYFKRRHKDQCNGKWNEASGTVNASQNVMHITDWNAGEMRTSFVINYIHGTNHVYFDNSISNFTDNIYLVIGHDYAPNGSDNKYSSVYLMEPVTGTNLYHVEVSSTWEDANFYAIIASTDTESALNTPHDWGSSSLSSKGTSGYTAAFKTVYNMEGGSFLITTNAAGNNQAMNINYYENHSSLPKFDASQAAKKRDTGTTYTDVSGSWPATLKLRGSFMKTSSDTARSTISSTASTDEDGNKTYSAIQSGLITQSYTGLDASYHFEGWGTGSAPTNTEATNEYHISGVTTVYAFFSKLYTLTYERKGDYRTSTLSVYSVDNFSGTTTSGNAIPTGHMITLVATPATGYEVEGWYRDADCTSTYTSGSDGVTIEGENTFKLASLNSNSGVYPKFRPKNYTIPLVNMEATTSGTTSVDVTYNASTNMTASDPIAKPSKTNYTFDGYWVRNESTLASETQLIDANGNWIKDVTGYTSSDGAGNPTWVHDYAISLYAKWTETIRTVNIAVEGEGSVQINSENVTSFNAGFVTPSAALTAVPANAAWVFKEWRFTKVEEDFQVYVADPLTYSSTSNPVVVNAIANTTLTAVFEHRYNLLGSKYEQGKDRTAMTSGGMPGWTYGSGADFTIHSYDAEGDNATVNMSYTCNLDAGTYMFEIHDRQKGESLGRKNGEAIYVLADRGSVELRGGEDKDQSIFFYPQHAGQYTFRITSMTKDGDYYYPTVTIERPHQMHFAHKRVDIDGDDHNDDLGGTLTATINGASAIDEQWFDYGSDVDWTATAETGYSLTWYTDNAYSNAMNPQPGASWSDPDITHDENIYAKFTETPTTVTLANDGHGHVEIGSGNTVTQTTVGVTTTRELTAVPNDGYMFSSWTETAKTDYSTTSTSTNPTTLRGGGTGAASQTLTANFTYRWALSAQSDGWGSSEFIIANISTDGSGDVIGYVDISLAANTNYQFKMVDKLTSTDYYNGSNKVYYMTYGNSSEWPFATDKTHNCGITTAGRGTYRFLWNVTDKTMTVTYQPSYQVNYGASVGGSVTSVVDDDGNSVPNGGYVRSGGSVEYTAVAANAYYTFAGWCTDDTYAMQFTDKNPWTNSGITANSNAYAKFKSTNFVIYRTGDKAEDSRAAVDDVESYAGGTISEAIEYRMKVHTLDQWTTLCLPFEVSVVKVWDPDDGPAYFDIVPYYRTGGKFYNGHYIIRTPKTATGLAIAEFDQWNDPTSATGYVPAKNTPYIIQWHESYFLGKYISFFGAAGQTIPTKFTAGAAPSSDNVVNVYGNDAMVSGSVRDAYLLESDYGSSGAWLRENIGTNRTINPFECYILANSATTTRYRILRRGATPDDTPTGWDDVINAELKTDITVYTITGFPVARYYDCSFTEAAQRLHREQGEGIYILRSANESVKLMVGGK